MAQGKFISYLRVSTDKQGRSGLGIEAQREAVTGYLNGGQWTLVSEYVETESGRKSDGPKLAAALSHAKAIGAKLVFAKLDRLTRNVDLLRSLVASDVDLVFCDLPSVPPGPMGKFLLTQMAAVAELEAGLIGERTKKALAAAKARGVKLGNPNGARALRGKQTGNAEAVAKVKEKATQRALDLQGIIGAIKSSGITSVRAVTEELNRQGFSAPRGGSWHDCRGAASRSSATKRVSLRLAFRCALASLHVQAFFRRTAGGREKLLTWRLLFCQVVNSRYRSRTASDMYHAADRAGGSCE
jgi:DNA invertase Pin-like site-specific DNA recombinase